MIDRHEWGFSGKMVEEMRKKVELRELKVAAEEQVHVYVIKFNCTVHRLCWGWWSQSVRERLENLHCEFSRRRGKWDKDLKTIVLDKRRLFVNFWCQMMVIFLGRSLGSLNRQIDSLDLRRRTWREEEWTLIDDCLLLSPVVWRYKPKSSVDR